MVSDHLSDFITRIRNGYRAQADELLVPTTKTVEAVAGVLVKEGYIKSVEKLENVLKITLKYQGQEPVIMGIKRVSKPGARIYSGVGDLPRVWGGLGINIISTHKGIISEREAKKLHTGGEVICQVW